jgi:hypothetical protein
MRVLLAVLTTVLVLGALEPAARGGGLPTTLFCGKWAGDAPVEQIKPQQCSTIGPDDSLAEGLVLKRLRWRHWGAATATAQGIIQPKTNDTIVVHATAYGRRKVCGSHYRYTRLRTTTQYGTSVKSFSARCAP